MVILVWAPAHFQHIVTDLADHFIAPHYRLLIIARLGGSIEGIGDLVAFGGEQKELGLDTGFDMHALSGGLINQAAQHIARGLGDILAFHDTISRHPGHFWFPWQLNHRRRIWHRQHIGVCGGHIEPGSEAGKTGTVFLHIRNRLRRNQFGPLPTKEVGK